MIDDNLLQKGSPSTPSDPGLQQCPKDPSNLFTFNATLSACEKGQQWPWSIQLLKDLWHWILVDLEEVCAVGQQSSIRRRSIISFNQIPSASTAVSSQLRCIGPLPCGCSAARLHPLAVTFGWCNNSQLGTFVQGEQGSSTAHPCRRLQ